MGCFEHIAWRAALSANFYLAFNSHTGMESANRASIIKINTQGLDRVCVNEFNFTTALLKLALSRLCWLLLQLTEVPLFFTGIIKLMTTNLEILLLPSRVGNCIKVRRQIRGIQFAM
jgi:hypothetical protein